MKPKRQFDTPSIPERLYTWLLQLYPREHRQVYGPLMRQAFRDSYREALDANGTVGFRFWLDVVDDEARSIAREQGAVLRERLQRLHGLRIELASGMALLGGGLVYVVRCVI